MENNLMFTPVKIGSCEIPNRFAVTAMVANMCTEDGYATEQYIKYHEAKAKGGWGLIITEDYGINRTAAGYQFVAGLYDEKQIPGHKELTDTVHKYGTKIFCQIYHAGRQTNHNVNGGMYPKACSPTACPWNREMATELTVDEIHEIVRQFGVTAGNAKKAGFDGIEIHAGNGYLIAGFMSTFQNKRTDEYGGCFNNRMRLLHEVYDAMRTAVGPDFPIMVRYSADEHVLSGRTILESRMVAQELEKWGVDAINCSNGVYGTFNPGQVSPSYQDHGWTVRNARELKNVVKIPVLGCNSIDDPLMAESLVAEGWCDIVGMARCSLADPEMPNKAKEGRYAEIRPCIRCMQGCTTHTYMEIPICCTVNPETSREYIYTYADTPEKKKVLIIGGGPAGLEAAIAAKRRGHDVTLWEATDKFGGQFIAAAYPPGKGDYITFLCYLENEIKKLGVSYELNHKATAEEILAFGADKVILATGGVPAPAQIPGADEAELHFAEDVLRGRYLPEGEILVVGGGETALEVAMYLADAERGHITLAARKKVLAPKADGTRVVAMKKFLREHEVELCTDTRTVRFMKTGAVLEHDGIEREYAFDAIIIAMGYRPETGLAAGLEALGEKLVIVGDAKTCDSALTAAADGYQAGYFA